MVAASSPLCATIARGIDDIESRFLEQAESICLFGEGKLIMKMVFVLSHGDDRCG
jgi:hypothetical protein